MNKIEIIRAFSILGRFMVQAANEEKHGVQDFLLVKEYDEFQQLIGLQFQQNGWFTPKYVRQAIFRLGSLMNETTLVDWTEKYSYRHQPKRVALIMAGNIPLVNFHDFLCVLVSGHHAVCKLSSDDKSLLPFLGRVLIKINPSFASRISFIEQRLSDFDAVIATGSDNSKLYFEQYFGKYPHVFRSNRTSLAVLSGSESEEQLYSLGNDMFEYFGRGCRNVTHILLPTGYDLDLIFKAIVGHSNVISNNKYANNYDYNKAICLMNKVEFLDNNFVLLRHSNELFSPIAMIHYHFYENEWEIKEYIDLNREKLQVVVEEQGVNFGTSQFPSLTDYPDHIDTMKFLSQL
jgi:hypothetical protein